jgi:hypothetical protein
LKTRRLSNTGLQHKTACVFFFLLFFLLTTAAHISAETRKLTDSELKGIYCQGATNLYIEGDTVRLFLDMHTKTFGEIDSAKAGYYEKDGLYNWDINWTDLTLGQGMDTPLVTDGLIIRTEFDDINAADKRLVRIMIGTGHINGRISGNFTTTTGAVNPEVLDGATGTDPIVMNRGTDLQAYENMDFSDSGFFIDINFDGNSPERGIKTIAGYAESQAINFVFSGGNWWQ